MEIGMEAGSETNLPGMLSKLPRLCILSLRWARQPQLGDHYDDYKYYWPVPRTAVLGIKRCRRLSVLRLYEVGLDTHELESTLRHLDGRLWEFETDLERGLSLLERHFAMVTEAARHCPALSLLRTNVEYSKEWRERSEAWERRLAAAWSVLEKRCRRMSYKWVS